MNAEQFVYWLNGYLELSGAQEMSSAQLKCVREHIALVLRKVTPPLEDPKPAYFGGGVRCGVCQVWCSNEGGVCNDCKKARGLGEEGTSSLTGEDLDAKNIKAQNIPASDGPGMTTVDVPCFLTC